MKAAKMIRNSLTILISLAVLTAILAYMSGTFHPKIDPDKIEAEARRLPPDATTYTVHAVVEMEQTAAVGTLRAKRRTIVSSKILATVSSITVREGDRVTTDQVLVRLDDRDLQARLEQAKKAVEGASAAADKAAADLKRYQSLYETKVASKQELDRYISQNKVAQAELQRAREGVNEAQVAMSYAVIKAPADGVVFDKRIDAGNTAAPGQPLLSIYDPKTLRLEAPVREALATQIMEGMRLETEIVSLNLKQTGVVDEVVPQALAESRSVLIKVAIPSNPEMVEGMYGQIMVPTRERRRFCIAQSAVLRVGQLRYVDVVTTGGGLERRSIKLGEHAESGRVEVISGVEAGETVMLHGPPPPPFPADHRFFGRDTGR